MKRAPDSPLVALSPGDLSGTDVEVRSLLARIQTSVEGGLRALVLREPHLTDRALLELARRVRGVIGSSSWLCVHDRVHVALAAEADAAHLGFRSLPLDAARRAAGEGLALGFSAHAFDDAAAWSGADYLFFGPVRATPSKAGLLEPTGFDALRRACASAAVPVFAIGGVEPNDARVALDAGARGVAVLRGILCAEDPAHATRAYLMELEP